MKAGFTENDRLERLLAEVLHYGTWLASGVIALGLALALLDATAAARHLTLISGIPIVTIGIALLILLPVLRVALMLALFLAARDYRLSAIAALVLAIIALGFGLGLALSRPPA